MEEKADAAFVPYNASVPSRWVGLVAPASPAGGVDLGQAEQGFVRNWQCFWAMLLTSIILVVTYISVKKEST